MTVIETYCEHDWIWYAGDDEGPDSPGPYYICSKCGALRWD